MINKNIIKTIGEKEMDRKDFLKYSGIALAAAVGLKSIVNILVESYDDKSSKNTSDQMPAKGFGGGRYGV